MKARRILDIESASKLEKKWAQFFEDPGLWWDNRSKNRSVTGEGLFISSSPPWVHEKLSCLEFPTPGSKGFRARYRGIEKTVSDFVAALKKCSKTRDLEQGKELHREARAAKCDTDRYVAAALITMYRKCQSVASARQVFDVMPRRDTVVWNTLILGYAENGDSCEAMDLFSRMDCSKDSFTYVAALKACGGLSGEKGNGKETCLEKGICIHRDVEEHGLDSNILVATTLVDMYSKCGDMQRARDVFDGINQPNVVAWNCIIMGYVDNGQSVVALDMFTKMDVDKSPISYIAALKACAGLAGADESKTEICRGKVADIHKEVVARGFDTDILVMTTLMDTYTRCSCMELALEVFSNLKCEPTAVTYVGALKACSGLAGERESSVKQKHLEKGLSIHKKLDERGFGCDLSVANTLLDMYAKFGHMGKAREHFLTLKVKDAVTWTCMILGYAENGESLKALEMFRNMDCTPDSVTYVAALQACGNLASLSVGRLIHASANRYGLDQEKALGNTLVDMYSKCSNMTRAEQMMSSLTSPNIVTWNALMSGYSSLGETEQVFEVADVMQALGVPLNGVSFICILTACSHAGMVSEGRRYFDSMTCRYSITPSVEHYTCMIDILGRANRLEEAVSLLNGMSFEADHVTWRAILGACRKWKNAEIGKVAFDRLVARDSKDAAAYVLLREIYDELAMEQDVGSVGDKVDKDVEQKLMVLLRDGVESEERHQCGHSERLAVVHGIVHGDPGDAVQVVKNMRMCNDCHRATSNVSRMEKREIIVKDASRVHIFRNGTCSCGDYW